MSGPRPVIMRPSALPCIDHRLRHPKSVALEHSSNADSARPRHPGIASMTGYPYGVGDRVLSAMLLGKTAEFFVDNECYPRENPPFSLSCCASTYLEISVEMPDKFGTRIRYSFRFAAQGCVSMRARGLRSIRCGIGRRGMWRLDSRNRPVAKRAPRMPLTPSAASTAPWCLFSVGPHATISIVDKTVEASWIANNPVVPRPYGAGMFSRTSNARHISASSSGTASERPVCRSMRRRRCRTVFG
jgi:hypothetical protein